MTWADVLDAIRRWWCRRRRAVRLGFMVRLESDHGSHPHGRYRLWEAHMAVEIPPHKRARLRVLPKDIDGNPAPIEAGSLTKSVSDPGVVTAVQDAADELVILVTRGTVLGVATLRVRADADPGSGVVPVTGEIEFSVPAGLATGLGFDAIVEDDPANPPPA
jgi:hypothetical protein